MNSLIKLKILNDTLIENLFSFPQKFFSVQTNRIILRFFLVLILIHFNYFIIYITPLWNSTPEIIDNFSYLENGSNFYFNFDDKIKNIYYFEQFGDYKLSYFFSLKIMFFIHFCWSFLNISKDYIPNKYSFLFAFLFSNFILSLIILF